MSPTSAPRAANSRAQARPMPAEAPVMATTFPSSDMPGCCPLASRPSRRAPAGSREAGVGHVDGGAQQHRLAGRLPRLLVEVRGGARDQRAAVLAAEPAGEDAEPVRHRDFLDDLAAGRDAAER